MADSNDITLLLNQWSEGSDRARDLVAPMIYQELKQIARNAFRGEGAQHTLQPTALVHEAYEKLVGVEIDWQDRGHFFALAARMMRRLLVNHAKSRGALKRGGNALHMTLHEDAHAESAAEEDVLALNEALTQLAELDDRKANILEMHYFGGLTQPQMANVLDVSESTVRREFKLARIWLKKLLDDGHTDTES